MSEAKFLSIMALAIIGAALVITHWPDAKAQRDGVSKRAWLMCGIGGVFMLPALTGLWVTAVFG